MKILEKIKGAAVFICGLALIVFIFNFDRLIGRPAHFGAKAIIGFIFGMIMAVNGIRIYRR